MLSTCLVPFLWLLVLYHTSCELLVAIDVPSQICEDSLYFGYIEVLDECVILVCRLFTLYVSVVATVESRYIQYNTNSSGVQELCIFSTPCALVENNVLVLY
jgi:hypothetical protein